jgi:hypothetical protein
VREREYTRSLAAMATLMRIDSPTNGSQGARAAGEGVSAAASRTMSVHRLHGVADALTHALGADHPEVLRARRNARVADTFASAPTSEAPGPGCVHNRGARRGMAGRLLCLAVPLPPDPNHSPPPAASCLLLALPACLVTLYRWCPRRVTPPRAISSPWGSCFTCS